MSDSYKIKYIDTGICGLMCGLCPSYHSQAESRCRGCKSADRIKVGCPFITCALKNRGIEFCWECDEHKSCEKWEHHRKYSHDYDTFTCYQKLEYNIEKILETGIDKYLKEIEQREKYLQEMLETFNDGRSRTRYCIVATVFKMGDLKELMSKAKVEIDETGDIKSRARQFHKIIQEIGDKESYIIKLRKPVK